MSRRPCVSPRTPTSPLLFYYQTVTQPLAIPSKSIIATSTNSIQATTMAKPFEADYNKAAAATSKTSPSDPIANSFAQYKQFALLRCSGPAAYAAATSATAPVSGTSVDATKQKASVSLVNITKNPELILTKWIDSEGVVRTRNRLDDPTAQEFFAQMRTQRWVREMHRAFDLITNKDDIRDHLLLNESTVQALRYYVSGDYSKFLTDVLKDKLITSDMLIRLSRGPIFEEWMVKQLIFDAVMKSAVDFNKNSADCAVAATAHFM